MEISECFDFDFLIRFLEGLQKFLGDKCEIVVHDFRKGYDHSLVYEFNAKLSGRKVGDSPRGGMISNLGKDIADFKDSMVFFYPGAKGQMFKSCTTLVADKEHRIIGSVCLNLDVSGFLLAQNTIQNFVRYDTETESAEPMNAKTVLEKNVDDVLAYYMQQSEALIGSPMLLMTKEEKIRALDYMDQRGIFKITKASNLLCDAFNISRYTLYNYLEEARSSHNHSEA